MDSIVKRLFENRIEESLSTVKLSDLIADSNAIVFVSDVDDYTASSVDQEFAKDYVDEDDITEDVEEEMMTRPDKITVSEEDIKKVISTLASSSSVHYSKRRKNQRFLKSHDLTPSDAKEIVRQLSSGDYSYSLLSKNEFRLGEVLSVFITGKDFDIQGMTLSGVTMYIKVDITDEGVVTIISIHEGKEGNHPYSEDTEEYDIIDNRDHYEIVDSQGKFQSSYDTHKEAAEALESGEFKPYHESKNILSDIEALSTKKGNKYIVNSPRSADLLLEKIRKAGYIQVEHEEDSSYKIAIYRNFVGDTVVVKEKRSISKYEVQFIFVD